MFSEEIARLIAQKFYDERARSGSALDSSDLVRIGELVRLQTIEEFGRAAVMSVIWSYERPVSNFESGWHFYEEFTYGLKIGGPNPSEMLPRHYARRMAHLIICEKVLNELRMNYDFLDPMLQEAEAASYGLPKEAHVWRR